MSANNPTHDPLDDLSPDEQYMRDLVEAAPETAAIMELVRKGYIFRGIKVAASLGTAKTGVNLTEREVEMTVDGEIVPWHSFHTKLLKSIFDHRATNKTNASILSRQHTDKKFDLLTELHRTYPPSIANASDKKKEAWRSAVDTLAIDFIREFENKIVKGGGDLLKEIEAILDAGDWEPVDGEHANTIYYIAGSVLHMVENRSNDKKQEFARFFAQLRENAASSREEAIGAALPTERVQETEAVGLTYPSAEFYRVMLKIESVFHNLLKDANVALFGPGVVDYIVHILSKQDVALSQFMPDAEEDEVAAVYRVVVTSYGNTRGKDFARKRNAKDGASHTETTRATLGTIDYLNQLKKEKRSLIT